MNDLINFYLIVTLLATVNSQEICNTTCIEEILTNQESSLEILQNFVEGCFYSFVTPISMQLETIMNTLSTNLETLQTFISRCFQIYITPLSQKVVELQEFIYNNQTSQLQEVAEDQMSNLETLQTFISRCFQIYITPLSQKVFELQQFSYNNQTSMFQEFFSSYVETQQMVVETQQVVVETQEFIYRNQTNMFQELVSTQNSKLELINESINLLNTSLSSRSFEVNGSVYIESNEFYRNLSLLLEETRESCPVPVCNCEFNTSSMNNTKFSAGLDEILYELSELRREISETKTSVQVVEESTEILEEIANKELDVSQWDLALTGTSIGAVLLLIIGCCLRLMCGGGGVEGNLCSLNCFNAG